MYLTNATQAQRKVGVIYSIYNCITHCRFKYSYLEIKNPKDVNEIDVGEENDEESYVIIYKSEQLLQSSWTILKLSWRRLPESMRPFFRAITHWQIHAHFVKRNGISYTFELRRGEGNFKHYYDEGRLFLFILRLNRKLELYRSVRRDAPT